MAEQKRFWHFFLKKDEVVGTSKDNIKEEAKLLLNVKTSKKSFPALLLLISLWILVISILISISLAAQNLQMTKSLKQSPKESRIILENGDILHISHPQELFIDGVGLKGAPFGFWVTCTVTTPAANDSCLSANNPQPYIIHIDTPNNSLGFTNSSGEPIPGQIILVPSLNPTPVVLYGALSSSDADITSLGIYTSKLYNTTPIFSSTVSIPIEKMFDAQLRNGGSLLATSAFWGTILTLAGGLVLAAWNKILADQKEELADQKEEKDKKEKQIEKEKENQKFEEEKIQSFQELIIKSPEESARLFIEYCKQEHTLSKDLFEKIKNVWVKNAPKELTMLSDLEYERLYGDLKKFIDRLDEHKKELINPALRFALIRMVDEAWKISANQIALKLIDINFSVDSDLLVILEKRYRYSITKVWAHMAYWQFMETPSPDANEEIKFKYLRKTASPLGTPKAEHDRLIVQSHYGNFRSSDSSEDYLYDEMTRDYSIIVLGTGSWGKTASAIWLLDQTINRKITALKGTNNPPVFPVYCPVPVNGSLNDIAKCFSLAILNYLAFEPSGFFQRSMVGKSSIAHLLSIYLASGTNLTLRFREAGLPKTGVGLELSNEITNLMKRIKLTTPVEEANLLKILGESFPFGFEKTWFILDFQGNLDANKPHITNNCIDLIQKIEQIGVVTKSFLSYENEFIREILNTSVPVRELRWQCDDLKGLIELRTNLTGLGSISEWCEPNARYPRLPMPPDERLVNIPDRTPRGVIQKANELFQRISKKQSPLTAEDLDEILGPI